MSARIVGFGTFAAILFYVSYFKGLGWVWGVGASISYAGKFHLCQPDNFYHPAFSIFVFYFSLERVLVDLCLNKTILCNPARLFVLGTHDSNSTYIVTHLQTQTFVKTYLALKRACLQNAGKTMFGVGFPNHGSAKNCRMSMYIEIFKYRTISKHLSKYDGYFCSAVGCVGLISLPCQAILFMAFNRFH
jgi:hypothetical protein